MLCHNIQSYLSQEHIRPDPTGGNGAHGFSNIIDNTLCQIPCRNPIHLQVGCCINKGFINGVGVNILWGKMLEKYTVDLRSAIDRDADYAARM